MQQLTRGMGVVAVAVAAVVGVSGCAGNAGADETSPPGVNASVFPAPSAEDKTAGSEMWTALSADVFGTALDRWRAGRVVIYKMESAFTECMAEHGFVHEPMDYSSSPMGQISPSDGFDEFTQLSPEFGIAAVKTRTAELEGGYTDPGFASLDAAGQARWADLVAGDCSQPWEPGLENSHVPVSLGTVSQALVVEVLEPVHNDPVVAKMRGDYASCVAGYGFTASSWAALRDHVAGLYPESASGTPDAAAMAADPVWKTAFEAEMSAAAADVACRSDMVAYATGLAYPALRAFVAAHASELEELKNEWNAMNTAYTDIFE